MGLDITAYRKLTLVPSVEGLSEDDRYELVRVFNIEHFSARAEGLEPDAYYEPSRGNKDCMDFRAGSYSGYNSWRDALAKLAGYPADPHADARHQHSDSAWKMSGGPFWELINFADNEGIIGPVVSAKLAQDFAEWDDRAKAAPDPHDGWFYSQYTLWRQAFEMAAGAGAVEFH